MFERINWLGTGQRRLWVQKRSKGDIRVESAPPR